MTIYDIARLAEVSPATVSRILTKSARVSDEKTKRVMQIIKESNFTPNDIARSLQKKSTKTIGVMVPEVTVAYFSRMFFGIEHYAALSGYSTILCNYGHDAVYKERGEEDRYLELLIQKQADGIVYMGGSIDCINLPRHSRKELSRIFNRVPTVLVNGYANMFSHTYLRGDDENGLQQAVEMLYNLGHRHFAFIGGIENISSTYYRLSGYKKALSAHNLPIDDALIIFDEFSVASGYNCMKELTDRLRSAYKPMPTAFVCVNDSVAIGVIKYATRIGLRIPDDISVVGFDNSESCDVVTPELTSVGYDIDTYAKEIVGRLCKKINEKADNTEPSAFEEILISTRLYERNTCGKVK